MAHTLPLFHLRSCSHGKITWWKSALRRCFFYFLTNNRCTKTHFLFIPTQTAVYVLMSTSVLTFPLPALFFFDGSSWSRIPAPFSRKSRIPLFFHRFSEFLFCFQKQQQQQQPKTKIAQARICLIWFDLIILIILRIYNRSIFICAWQTIRWK